MKRIQDLSVVVVSHASIKQINRAVYRILDASFSSLELVVPASLKLGSGVIIHAEPQTSSDPTVLPFELVGTNPRTYGYPGLIDHLNKRRPDVVILENDPVSKLGFQLSSWCRRNDAKLICQTYENFRRDVSSTLRRQGVSGVFKSLPLHLLNFVMAKRVDGLLVVNRVSERIFRDYAYRRVTLVPLGFDPTVFHINQHLREQYRKKMGIRADDVVIAYFGRLVRQKGVHLLVQALSQVPFGNWKLLLDAHHDAQNTYAEEVNAKIKELNLTDRVIHFHADHFEIANYMRAADIAVAPSLTTTTFMEQYGRAVQEAMGCGCVCLVSDSGHLKDLVGNSKLVFSEGNVREIVTLLTHFFTDPQLRLDVGKSLAARAQAELTIGNQASALRDLIKELVT